MPIPAIVQALAFGGVIGGRALQRRDSYLAAQQLQDLQASAFSGGLAAFGPSQAQQLQPGEMGPALPADGNLGLLEQGEINALEQLYQADPRLAGDLLKSRLATAEADNQRQQNYAIELQDANRAAQQMRLNERNVVVSENRLDLDRDKFTAEQQQVLRTRALQQGSLYDPLTAERVAAQQGEDRFAVYDRGPDGQPVLRDTVPVSGSDEWRQGVNATQFAVQGVSLVNDLAVAVLNQGPSLDPGSAEAREYQAKRTQLLFNLKEATKAGALDQGLLDVVEQLIPDANAWSSQLLSTPDALIAQLSQASELFNGDQAQGLQRIQNYNNLPPELLQQARSNMATTEAVRNIVARNAEDRRRAPGIIEGARERAPNLGLRSQPERALENEIRSEERAGNVDRAEELREQLNVVRRTGGIPTPGAGAVRRGFSQADDVARAVWGFVTDLF